MIAKSLGRWLVGSGLGVFIVVIGVIVSRTGGLAFAGYLSVVAIAIGLALLDGVFD